MRNYKVFRLVEADSSGGAEFVNGGTWEVVGDYPAHDAKGAITAAATELLVVGTETDPIFAATPAASWKWHGVRVEVETKVRIA